MWKIEGLIFFFKYHFERGQAKYEKLNELVIQLLENFKPWGRGTLTSPDLSPLCCKRSLTWESQYKVCVLSIRWSAAVASWKQ